MGAVGHWVSTIPDLVKRVIAVVAVVEVFQSVVGRLIVAVENVAGIITQEGPSHQPMDSILSLHAVLGEGDSQPTVLEPVRNLL